MSLIREDQIDPTVKPLVRPVPVPADEPFIDDAPSFAEILPTDIATNTYFGRLAQDALRSNYDETSFEADPDFDPADGIIGTRYEPYINELLYSNSKQEQEYRKRKIDEIIQQKEFISSAGTGAQLMSSLATGIIDPINFIPFARSVSVANAASRTAFSVGLATAESAAKSVAVSEALLQTADPTRTAEESAINIAGGTLLSGVLGSTIARIGGKPFYDEMAPKVEKDINEENTVLQNYNDMIARDASAMATPKTTMSQETLEGALGLEKGTAFLNPMLRVLNSSSVEARRTIQELAENSLIMRKNSEGIASAQSVETAVDVQYGSRYGLAMKEHLDNYKQYVKSVKSAGEKPMKFREFDEATGEALYSGDVGVNDFVTKSAGIFRSKVFDPFKDEAISLGKLPEDVKPENAKSYFTQAWNRKAIIAYEPEFRKVLKKYIDEAVQPAIIKEFGELNKKIAKAKLELDRAGGAKTKEKLQQRYENLLEEKRQRAAQVFEGRGDPGDYADEIVDDIYRKLTGQEAENLAGLKIKIAARGPLKERTLNIPQERAGKFLHKDVSYVAARYSRIMAAENQLTAAFGDPNMTKQIKAIQDEYKALAAAAKTEKERIKLDKEMTRTIKDIEAVRDLIRGVHSTQLVDPDDLWQKAGVYARLFQFVTKMGGVVLGSVPDIGKLVMNNGMGVFLKATAGPLIKSLATMKKTGALRSAMREANLAGEALERVLLSRTATMSDIADPVGRGTAFDRFVNNVTREFSRFTLMSQWNDAMKSVAAMMTQTRLLSAADGLAKGKLISANDTKYLTSLGIGKGKAERIGAQFAKYGEKDGGMLLANSEKWDDAVAQEAFRNAIAKEIRRTIVTKTTADTPLVLNTGIGKVIAQFKSFVLASHQKTFLYALQRRDAAVLNGIITSVGLGMLVYYLRTPEEKLSDDPRQWVFEGIERSGLLGVVMEANNVIEKMGIPGMAAAMGAAPSSRYQAQDILTTLAGPTAGTIKDIGTTVYGLANDSLTDSDISKMRRMIPFNNVFWLKGLFDRVEEAAK